MSINAQDVTTERVLQGFIYVIGVALTGYTLFYAFDRPFVRVRHANIFLGAGVALFYLVQAERQLGSEAEPNDPVTDASALAKLRSYAQRVDPVLCIALAAVAVASALYVETNFQRLLYDAPVMGYRPMDVAFGVAIITLVTDATRRAYGWAISVVVMLSLAYAFLGPYVPGFLTHSGMSVGDVARYGAIGLSGVYGFILGIGTTWVAIFIMFAGLAKEYGALEYVLDVGQEFGNRLSSGVVHVAVISSMAMGSITGSAAANTATTGSFTIPMMQRQGVRDDFAAAIESVASSGGQMMPPVMGVAAFIMADILQVPYVRVIQAGILPAMLFYFSVGISVHLVVQKFGWTTSKSKEFDRSILAKGVHFIVPLAVLIYTLVVMRLTPLSAGLYTTIVMVATMYVRNLAMDGASLETLVDTTKRTLKGFEQGAVDMAPLVGVLGAMGIIISMLTQTGLSQKISIRMVALGGGVLVVVLVLAMFSSILFGLGMPTPAAYILVVILVAPALIELDVPDITAHLFVFYFAMLSAITPPVAVAVAVGSRIADSEFLVTGKQALRIGAAGFLIPFAFIVNKGLIFWSFPRTVIEATAVFAGVLALSVAIIGYDSVRRLSLPQRAGYLTLAFLAMYAPALAAFTGKTVGTGLQLAAVAVTLGALGFTHQNAETLTPTQPDSHGDD